MERKFKFFKNVFANLTLAAVVLLVLVFSLVDNNVAVGGGEAPVYKGNSKTAISLMINVYWGTEYIDQMLEILESNEVKTTFFVGGSWAAENDTMLKKIYDKGHEIGNHGYYHKDHKKLSDAKNKQEIELTHKMVKGILGIEMTLFAPPSGSFSGATIEGAKALGYTSIMWTYDTIDWRDKDTELIYKRATKNLEGGNLILMHPTKNTLNALDRIIKTVKEKGLTVAPVSQVL